MDAGTTDHVDLAVIGSGSGNSLVTPDWEGKRVAIIESGAFGGTCLNVGCIPTKMFVYPAEVAAAVREASRYGVDAHVDGVRWRDIRDRVFGRIDPISEGGKRYRLEGENTTAYLGRARFTGERTLEVALNDGGTARVEADQIVVATGSHAVVPDVVRESGVPFHTSDTVMRIDDLPPRVLIIGGGYIATEFAHVFADLGVEVTLVARGPRLLRHLDGDVARRFTEAARTQWDVRLETRVEELTPSEAGEGLVDARLSDSTRVEGALLLVCTGRAPSVADLDLPAAGIAQHDDSRIVVDEHGRTSVPGVWALGDVSSEHQLKHVANHEARVVAHNLVHGDDLRSFDERFVPAAVFTRPQIAAVGATQEELDEAGTEYRVKVQEYADVAYGWAMEDTVGFCKVLAAPDGRLLGVHVMGHEASIVVQPAILALNLGLTAAETARGQMWIHPALPEVLENALLGVVDPEN
ncbi:mycothione reductase [Mobilicoccus pelagius]|uniref:Mycothione reductase n=1 Tax=Mobilicoccus pelagius NBRC 104925 TaxID=1089455 RepID=H5URV8_9MICO|nr:mycothione reductase [Mobilicoccus pelagius]GAB48466.1 mycothione reductase [Mobilicoccus pelagius NBRC 104925]